MNWKIKILFKNIFTLENYIELLLINILIIKYYYKIWCLIYDRDIQSTIKIYSIICLYFHKINLSDKNVLLIIIIYYCKPYKKLVV